MSSRINEKKSPVSGTQTIANAAFDAFELGGTKLCSAQIIATGLDAADGTVFVEQSNNKTNWDESGVSFTLPSGNSSNTFELTDVSTRYIRISSTIGSNTVGELSVLYVSK